MLQKQVCESVGQSEIHNKCISAVQVFEHCKGYLFLLVAMVRYVWEKIIALNKSVFIVMHTLPSFS